jgi:integrase
MATYRKRGDKWEFRISYKDPFSQKYRVKSKSGFNTKKDAQNAARLQEQRIEDGINDSPTSLKEYLIVWLNEYKKNTVRKNTFDLHERNIKNHIIPYFKDIQLTSIKPIMYQKFLNHLANQNYSKRTIEIIHGTMFGAFKKAVILEMIDKNPCDGITIPKQINNKKEGIRYISSNDIPLFLQTAFKYNYVYYVFFLALIETGMRKGEAAALQWPDINLKKKYIDVNKTLDFQAKSEDQLFGDPKTFESSRRITITDAFAEVLKEHKKWQFQNKNMLKVDYKHDLNLVFSKIDGSHLPKSTLFNAFNKILNQTNIDRIPIHDLRHTHAVLLLEAGASMKYIQERLGHKSMAVTADIYAHISEKIDKETVSSFEEYMNKIRNPNFF